MEEWRHGGMEAWRNGGMMQERKRSKQQAECQKKGNMQLVIWLVAPIPAPPGSRPRRKMSFWLRSVT